MTVLDAFRSRLGEIDCRVELSTDGLDIVGKTDHLAREILVEARRVKPALIVELLREQAEALVAFIDGDTPLVERQAKLHELLVLEDRLSAAQVELWSAWRRAGFVIMWSTLVEEFVLVGDSPPLPGSEGMTTYTWGEVEALRDANPERLIDVHRVKKAFRGRVMG